MNDINTSLIYGKDNTSGVVSVEYNDEDNIVELFIQKADGSITSEIREYKPYILIPSKPYNNPYKQLHGKNHYKYLVEFNSKQGFYDGVNRCNKQFGQCYTNFNFKDQFLIRSGVTYYKDLHPKDISILSFDIETNGLKKDHNSKVYLITNTFRKNSGIEKVIFNIEDYDSQTDMILDWCDWVRFVNPSILLGHNILSYDIPFLIHVTSMDGESLCLGRDNSNIVVKKKPSAFRKDGSQSYEYHDVNVYGREVIDTFFLSIKYDIGRKYESYALKQIVRQEGLEKKDRAFIDASKITEYYENRHMDRTNWDLTIKYASEDSDDAIKLYDLMIAPFFYLNRSVPVCFQNMINKATGSQINSFMIRAYLQEDHSIPQATDSAPFEGAISFGIPGLYKNCFKVDVASLYPSIMREYQVYNESKDPKKYFLATIEYFTLERLKNKKLAKETGNKYYNDLQEAQKIFINSLYGFMGAAGLNFNYPKGAAFVTMKGREILQKAIKFATSFDFNYWVGKSNGTDDDEEDNESVV